MNKEINEELKRYINKNIDLINSEDWQEVFSPDIFNHITNEQVRELVEMLKSSGVVIPAERVFSNYDEFYEDDSEDVYDHANQYIGSKVNEEFKYFNHYRIDDIIAGMEASSYYEDHDKITDGNIWSAYPEKCIMRIIIQENYYPDFSIEFQPNLVKAYFYNSDIIKYVNVIPGIGYAYSLSGIQEVKDQIIADIESELEYNNSDD